MRHNPSPVAARLITMLLAIAAATACGSDGDTDAAACDAFVAIDREMSVNEDVEAGIAAIETFAAEVPDDIARDVEPLLTLLREDPEAAFESEELANAETTTDDWALEHCTDTRVELDAINFGFTGAPERIDAGRVGFAITNHTQTDEVHEALLLRKNDDVEGSAHDVLAAALDGRPLSVETTLGAFAQFELVGGGLVEPPGGDGYDVFVVDLAPGEYIVACLLPEHSAELVDAYFEGEHVDSTYHFAHGMFVELTVT